MISFEEMIVMAAIANDDDEVGRTAKRRMREWVTGMLAEQREACAKELEAKAEEDWDCTCKRVVRETPIVEF